MITKTIEQIKEMILVKNDVTPFHHVEISGVAIDSRKIVKGNLFIPFKGEQVDGHEYVKRAIEAGAAAALWQSDVPNPPSDFPLLVVEDTLIALQQLARSYRSELDVKVVGITGSNGKTSTKDMVASMLRTQYKVQKTEGNFNNHLGLPLTILQLRTDTDIAVLEMGMSGKGEIEFLTKLAMPEVVVITNIGEAHLQDLGSRERIADAKVEILKGLTPDGLVIYDGDEPLLQERIGAANSSIQTFGRNDRNTLYPTRIVGNDKGSIFNVNGTEVEFALSVLGVHNVLNALAAMLVARHFEVSYEKMNEGLASLKLTSMRMELVEGEKGERIINDAYNASPTSTRAAIDLMTNLTGYQRKILVLGDMLELGSEEVAYHLDVGRNIDCEQIDFVFTYGPLGEHIAQGAKENFKEERVFAFQEKDALILELEKYRNESTLILVKGSRGMKLEEIVIRLQKK